MGVALQAVRGELLLKKFPLRVPLYTAIYNTSRATAESATTKPTLNRVNLRR